MKRSFHKLQNLAGRQPTMAVRLLVAVTDRDWFEFLRTKADLSEANFWAPGTAPFKALEAGELFLFKLHAPLNFIVGGGFFAYTNTAPCSLAWEAFHEANGAASLAEMRQRIIKYRRIGANVREDFSIGCRILTQPFFFDEPEWITVPGSFSPNIVTFKTYDASEGDGLRLWQAVQDRLAKSEIPITPALSDPARYGTPILIRPRLGQGAFRIMVTDAYRRRCVITGDPLRVRKATLASIVAKAHSGMRFNQHIEGDGPTVFAHACKMGPERQRQRLLDRLKERE